MCVPQRVIIDNYFSCGRHLIQCRPVHSIKLLLTTLHCHLNRRRNSIIEGRYLELVLITPGDTLGIHLCFVCWFLYHECILVRLCRIQKKPFNRCICLILIILALGSLFEMVLHFTLSLMLSNCYVLFCSIPFAHRVRACMRLYLSAHTCVRKLACP